jgi:hypothetical protein
VNRPGVAAGLVGAGVAIVVAIAFELVFAVQVAVFLLALPTGLLMGWYAVERARRALPAGTRPGWGSVVGDGVLAGAITGLALALVYVSIRLVFLFLDDGFRAGGAPYACSRGAECSYQRALDDPRVRPALEAAGVRDVGAYQAYFLEGQLSGAAALIILVTAGGVVGAVGHRLGSSGPSSSTILAEGPR